MAFSRRSIATIIRSELGVVAVIVVVAVELRYGCNCCFVVIVFGFVIDAVMVVDLDTNKKMLG